MNRKNFCHSICVVCLFFATASWSQVEKPTSDSYDGWSVSGSVGAVSWPTLDKRDTTNTAGPGMTINWYKRVDQFRNWGLRLTTAQEFVLFGPLPAERMTTLGYTWGVVDHSKFSGGSFQGEVGIMHRTGRGDQIVEEACSNTDTWFCLSDHTYNEIESTSPYIGGLLEGSLGYKYVTLMMQLSMQVSTVGSVSGLYLGVQIRAWM